MAEEKIPEKLSKVKKKKWVKIAAPKLFNNEIVGEIPVTEPKSLVNKLISVNLMTITHDMKKQNTSVKFLINDVQGDRAITELYGYSLSASSVRRLVRKGKERIDMSFVCKTLDNKNVRIKPLLITPIKVKGSVSVLLKKIAKMFMVNTVSKTPFDVFVKDLIIGKVHKGLKDELKKTYPIRVVEISAFNIEKEGKAKKEEVVIEQKEGEEEDIYEEEKPAKKEEAPVQGDEETEESGEVESQEEPLKQEQVADSDDDDSEGQQPEEE